MARIPAKKCLAFRATVYELSVIKWSATRIALQINKLRFLGKTIVSGQDIRDLWKKAGSRKAYIHEFEAWKEARAREREQMYKLRKTPP